MNRGAFERSRISPRVTVVNSPSGVQLDVDTATSEPGDVVIAFARNQAELQQQADQDIEEARQMWRENLEKGFCTQEEFDKEMRALDEA